jgi:hypothetical protein
MKNGDLTKNHGDLTIINGDLTNRNGDWAVKHGRIGLLPKRRMQRGKAGKYKGKVAHFPDYNWPKMGWSSPVLEWGYPRDLEWL